MSEHCTVALDWLARQGVGLPEGEGEAAAHAAHVAACPRCSATLRRYRSFDKACNESLQHQPSPESESQFLRAAAISTQRITELELQGAAEASLEHHPAPEAEERLLRAARAQRASRPPRRRILAIGAALATAAALLLAWFSWPGAPPEVPPVEPVATASEAPGGFVVLGGGPVTVDGRPWEGTGTLPALEGHTLATGSEARIELSDSGDRITIEADSRIDIAAWGPKHTRLVLEAGTLEATVSPRPAEHPFEVLTPQARVVVVGTRFSVALTHQAETIVRTVEGLVRVERSDGEVLGLLSAGQELRVSSPDPTLEERVAQAPVKSLRNAPSTPNAKPGKETFLQPAEPLDPALEPPALEPLEQARAWLGEGQDDKAIALLQALPSDDWERDALLGDAHRITGRLELAEQAYARALSLSPHPPASLLAELATLQSERGRLGEAAATWRRYLEDHPEGREAPTAHLALGELALDELQQSDAERHLRAVLDKAPSAPISATALALLGRALIEQERWDDAEALFAPLAERSAGPCAEPALVGLIRVRIAQDRPREAAALVDRYHQRFSSGARAHELELLEQAIEERRR